MKNNVKLIFVLATSIVLFSATNAWAEAKDQVDGRAISNIDAYAEKHDPYQVSLEYETEEEYQERMTWWVDAKFGMFIHWGLYSLLGGEYNGQVTPKIAEWIQHTLKISKNEYQSLIKDFNPEKFDADEWVKIAKDAGMKYIVLTSKHHDGFALFDSKVSGYDVTNSAYKKDIVKQLKEAAYKQGLKFGLYYSHVIDWEHPHAYTGEGELRERMNHVDYNPDQMDRSVFLRDKSYPQLREILSNYGKIDVLWFDMGDGLTVEETREFVRIAREHQPQIIISSRVGADPDLATLDREQLFDYYVPSDNYFTGERLRMPWEMAGTTNGSWGYRKDDHEWRSAGQILNTLLATTSRGGNYLLNVGPRGDGSIPEKPRQELLKAGAWLKSNGESIYGASGSPFPWNFPWGHVTQKPGKVYLSVFDWPADNQIVISGLQTRVRTVEILDNGKQVGFEQKKGILSIDLNGLSPTGLATVFKLSHDDNDAEVDRIITQTGEQSIRLDRITSEYFEKN